jgi:hypothetical protein
MKNLFVLPVILALASFGSCQKQQTEEKRKAEIEREVQARLAAEHQTQQQQELEQRQTDLDAREKALAEKEKAASESAPVQSESRTTPYQVPQRAETRPTSSYSMFYAKLEPYGDWIETGDYGYVWHPSDAERSRNWRPYTIGRWVYSDVGWMWVSDEPFGWAAYHYGRWIRLRGTGWVWVPGETWAPAWVSWRKSNDYVGWAPLPPEARFDARSGIHNWADNYYDIGPEQYAFVPTRQFGTQRIAPVVVSSEQNVNIVNQTINVTNITYNNTTVVNYGPDYDDLQTRTQQPIERLRVERRMNIGSETPQTVVKGEVIEVPAPVISKAQPAPPPRRVKEKIAKATVERGWEGVRDPRVAETLRAKIKAESTPPSDAPPKTFVKPVEMPSSSAVATPVSTMTPSKPTPPVPTNPSPTVPHRSPPTKPSVTPKTTTTATPTLRSPHPVHSPISSPTPLATTSPAPVKATVSPNESISTVTPALPKSARPKPGEKKDRGRKSVGQQFEPRRAVPAAAPPASASPTSSEPVTSATPQTSPPGEKYRPESTAAERKQEKKKERRKGRKENQSPTPGSPPEQR